MIRAARAPTPAAINGHGSTASRSDQAIGSTGVNPSPPPDSRRMAATRAAAKAPPAPAAAESSARRFWNRSTMNWSSAPEICSTSTLRIAAAMKLLEDGKGTRLLVSGVNRRASRADIRSVSKAPGRLYDCCVDLGFSAANTLGNAKETAAWARAHGFHRLIVVTSDYHMPRAVLELHGALPEGQFTSYPVASDDLDVRQWWRTRAGARRILLEYSKYLVILAREAVLSLGPRDHPAQAAAHRSSMGSAPAQP